MDDHARLVETIKQACVEAALAAYEDAQIRGLCREGAWECAIEAIRQLDVKSIMPLPGDPPAGSGTVG